MQMDTNIANIDSSSLNSFLARFGYLWSRSQSPECTNPCLTLFHLAPYGKRVLPGGVHEALKEIAEDPKRRASERSMALSWLEDEAVKQISGLAVSTDQTEIDSPHACRSNLQLLVAEIIYHATYDAMSPFFDDYYGVQWYSRRRIDRDHQDFWRFEVFYDGSILLEVFREWEELFSRIEAAKPEFDEYGAKYVPVIRLYLGRHCIKAGNSPEDIWYEYCSDQFYNQPHLTNRRLGEACIALCQERHFEVLRKPLTALLRALPRYQYADADDVKLEAHRILSRSCDSLLPDKDIMTPTQERVAKCLAGAYKHIWKDVPNGTYSLPLIKAIAMQWEGREPGIYPMGYIDNMGELAITHVTGSGRLSWEVSYTGNVELKIYRPIDAFSYSKLQQYRNVYDYDARKFMVAAVNVLNHFLEDAEEGKDPESEYAPGEIEIGTSSFEKSHKVYPGQYEDRPQICAIDDEKRIWWNYYPAEERQHPATYPIIDNYLFERHVNALVRPLVALLTLKEQEAFNAAHILSDEPTDEEREQHSLDRKTFHETVICPAIDRAKRILAVLYDIALPDPLDLTSTAVVEGGYPAAFWTEERQHDDDDDDDGEVIGRYVHAYGESFPVESELTAAHAVRILRQYPEMTLPEAIKEAIISTFTANN